MRNIFLIILFLTLPVSVFSQEKEYSATYYSSYYGKSYKVTASANYVYVYCESTGWYSTRMTLVRKDFFETISNSKRRTKKNEEPVPKESNLQKFKRNLKEAVDYYMEWTETAKANDVRDFQKTIPVERNLVGGSFFYDGNWEVGGYSWSDILFIVEDGRCLLAVSLYLSHITRDREEIWNNGKIVFTSAKEVDDFLDVLDEEKMDAALAEYQKVDDLFK